jgi:hypothetical protein
MRTETRTPIRYEDAAELRTGKTGWCCKTCGRSYGDNEHLARWCHSTDLPCECGGRNANKYYTCCDACREKAKDAAWLKSLESAVEWDGKTPLYSETKDRYYFDAESIHADLDLNDDQEPDVEAVAKLRLILCEPNNGRYFDMDDYLCDDLGEDIELDCEDINRVVNDWIKAHAPFSWTGSGAAVTAESVLANL